jgi:hypothetical protein
MRRDRNVYVSSLFGLRMPTVLLVLQILFFCVARLHKQQIFLEFFKMLKKQSVRLDQSESGTVCITITVYGLNFLVSVGIFHRSSS